MTRTVPVCAVVAIISVANSECRIDTTPGHRFTHPVRMDRTTGGGNHG